MKKVRELDEDLRLEFEVRQAVTASFGYTNKCVPIALSMILQRPVLEVLDAIEANPNCTRTVPKNSGYWGYEYKPWLRRELAKQGKELKLVPLEIVRRHAKTTMTLTPAALAKLRVTDGYCITDGHMAGIHRGHLLDWSHNRRLRIKRLYRVESV
jgi:hypothetical protein